MDLETENSDLFSRPDELFEDQSNSLPPTCLEYQFPQDNRPNYKHSIEKCKLQFHKVAKKQNAVTFEPQKFILGKSAQKAQFVKKTGKLCEFVRCDTVLDKFGQNLNDTRPSPHIYEQTVGYFANFCNNRLTVYDTELWDGKMRPIYSMNNFSEVGSKSQIEKFGKRVDKPHSITCFDWVGNKDDTQILFAEKSGTMFRICLQQRSIVAAWKDGEQQIKQIATHYKSTAFATLDKSNTIRLYTQDIDTTSQSIVVAELKFSGNIVEIQWFGEELFLLSQDGLVWKVILDLRALQKIPATTNNPVHYPQRKRAKKVVKLKAKQVLKFDKKHKPIKFKKAGGLLSNSTAFVQCKDGTLIEIDMKRLQIVNEIESEYLNLNYGFALHPTRRILATSDESGKLVLLNYPQGTEAQSVINRGLGLGKGGQSVHWCSGKFKDSIVVTAGKTMTRFITKNSKILNTKRANSNCFTTGLPYRVNMDAMDQSNVDHNHRDYQFNANDAISAQSTQDGEIGKKIAIRNKILEYNMKYYRCMIQPHNLKRFQNAEEKGEASIYPTNDWEIPDKIEISEASYFDEEEFLGKRARETPSKRSKKRKMRH